MILSGYTQGKDNNFNLIRVVAALAVLVTHSFTVLGHPEPFRDNLGLTLGDVAVDIFFITSGFLVTSSLLNRKSILDFLLARFLRIYPALWVMVFLTVFVLGAFLTPLSLLNYFQEPMTYDYWIKSSTLYFKIGFFLPGVFDGNPYRGVVNGSLWTMPFEVYMYTILAAVYVVFQLTRKYRPMLFKISIVVYALFAGVYILTHQSGYSFISLFMNFSFMFFYGAAFYVLKDHIFLSRILFWFIIVALLLASLNKHIFFTVFNLSIAYILFFLAYVPSGCIRKYNLLGDYSYGIYLYAFPVQQTIVALMPGVTIIGEILISAILTILLAIISWHFLERQALGFKGLLVESIRKFKFVIGNV